MPFRKTAVALTPEWVRRPFQAFVRLEAAGGLLLMGAAAVALAWSNSPAAGLYFDLWHLELGVEALGLSKELGHWVNDGLMALFFLLVGLEIKRELREGELATPRQAVLPGAAALGGMIVPAAIYLAVTRGGAGSEGWGIPVATDIAFALGVLLLLGSRVPTALKVFLTAVAIVDDIGAVLLIALFYSGDLSVTALGVAGGVLVALLAANRLGVRTLVVYGALGLVLWLAVLKSGIHATLAGILLAAFIPSRPLQVQGPADPAPGNEESPESGDGPGAAAGERAGRTPSPLHRLEHALHPWVVFGVLPVFALANAGVALGGTEGVAGAGPVILGTMAGLLVGKPVGILFFSFLAVRLGWAVLPRGVGWRHVLGMSLLCGIGFTMSLFIAGLAFADAGLLDAAKVGVFSASILAALGGVAVLMWGKDVETP